MVKINPYVWKRKRKKLVFVVFLHLGLYVFLMFCLVGGFPQPLAVDVDLSRFNNRENIKIIRERLERSSFRLLRAASVKDETQTITLGLPGNVPIKGFCYFQLQL